MSVYLFQVLIGLIVFGWSVYRSFTRYQIILKEALMIDCIGILVYTIFVLIIDQYA